MTVGTSADEGAAPPRDEPFREPTAWWAVPSALAVVGAAALFLPWWRPVVGPVLLGGGPLRALAPDSWPGYQVAGLRAPLVLTLVAFAVVTAGVSAFLADGRGTRAHAAGAGASAAACGVAALVDRGPSGPPGPWLAVVAGLAAVGVALLPRTGTARTPRVLGAALLAVAGTVVCPVSLESHPPDRAGPFLRVAPVGPSYSVRTGSTGLSSTGGDTRPVVVDGAPGILTPAAVIVADPQGRARVLARTDPHAPPPLGVAGRRVVRWVTADTLAVTELRPDGPLEVVVRDVGAASPLGDDGSVWLRSDVDPPETVRRLDLASYDGTQHLSAVYLPVVTIQDPDGEPPIDVRTVRPVPGGALRWDGAGDARLQLLTGTAAGIAVRPVLDPSTSGCRPATTVPGDLRAVAADASGVWFPTGDLRLAHRAPDGTVRTLAARLPGPVGALAAPGDGSLLFTAPDADGLALWRLPAATGALAPPATPAC